MVVEGRCPTPRNASLPKLFLILWKQLWGERDYTGHPRDMLQKPLNGAIRVFFFFLMVKVKEKGTEQRDGMGVEIYETDIEQCAL